jgi:drug/metabolite transporter (DMT)-like permease
VSRKSGYLFAVSSALASAVATVVGKWNLESISPFLMNSLIFSVASVILIPFAVKAGGLRTTRTISKSGWKWLLLFASTSMVSVLAFWSGVQRMDPTLAAFLNRAEVPVAIILGVLFLRERFTIWETIGTLISIGGIVVMRLSLRVEYSVGFWLVLSGALLFGYAEYCSKRALAYVEPLLLTTIRNLIMCALYWAVFVSVRADFAGLERVWPGVIALGLLGPLLTRLLYLEGLKRMALSKAAVISQSQPVFVLVIAFAAFSQLPTLRETTGGLLILAGCILMIVARQRWLMLGSGGQPPA